MDQSRDLASVFCLYRNTVAVSAHGYDRILQISAQGTVDHTGQGRMYLIVHLADGAADMLQSAACVVADLVFFENAAPDLGG